MSSFTLLSLISALTVLFLGSFVFSLNRKNRVNQLFYLFSIFLFSWAFPEFMRRQAESHETAALWLRMTFLWPFVIASLIHFTLVFTEKEKFFKKKVVYLLIYGPPVVFSFILLLSDLWTPGPLKVAWGYTYSLPENMFFHNLSTFWAAAIVLLSFFMLLKFYYSQAKSRKKKQAGYISAGLLVALLAGTISQAILPALNIRIPSLTTASFTIMCVFDGLAIWKHGLFSINPATAADKILETMDEFLVLMNPQGKIVKLNNAALDMLGYSEKELIGKEASFIFTEKENSKELNFKKLIKTGGVKNRQMHIKLKSGEKIPANFSCSKIKDKRGDLRGCVGVAADLRQLHRLHDKMIEAEKTAALGDLAAGVAHEMNNPLGGILATAQLMIEEADERGGVYEDLKKIEKLTLRCSNSLKRFLNFARRKEDDVKKINLNSFIEKLVSNINRRDEFSDIEIIKSLEQNLPAVNASSRQMGQVLENLLLNAREEMSGGGKISIKTKKILKNRNAYVLVSIRDTGGGMSKEAKNKIFEPCYTTKKIKRGTGLGLPVAKSILEDFGAKIEVESSPGRGAEFRIIFPAC